MFHEFKLTKHLAQNKFHKIFTKQNNIYKTSTRPYTELETVCSRSINYCITIHFSGNFRFFSKPAQAIFGGYSFGSHRLKNARRTNLASRRKAPFKRTRGLRTLARIMSMKSSFSK